MRYAHVMYVEVTAKDASTGGGAASMVLGSSAEGTRIGGVAGSSAEGIGTGGGNASKAARQVPLPVITSMSAFVLYLHSLYGCVSANFVMLAQAPQPKVGELWLCVAGPEPFVPSERLLEEEYGSEVLKVYDGSADLQDLGEEAKAECQVPFNRSSLNVHVHVCVG